MKQCKFPIRTNYALAKDDNLNLCVIVLDDTRWLRSTTYGGWSKRVAPVLKVLRRELKLKRNTQPKWYWDFTFDSGWVLHYVHFRHRC